MNEVIGNMLSRRSVKQYNGKKVEAEKLDAIIEAGRFAPTGSNRQPLAFLVVEDKATRDALSRMNAAVVGVDIDPFYGAPTVVVVLARAEVSTRVEDGALAIGNMLNAAHSLGVGACWIHRAREMFERPEGKELLQRLGLTGEWQGIGCCILGYSDAPEKEAGERKSLVVRT